MQIMTKKKLEDLPEDIASVKEVQLAFEVAMHRIQNLEERYRGKTPNPEQLAHWSKQMIERVVS